MLNISNKENQTTHMLKYLNKPIREHTVLINKNNDKSKNSWLHPGSLPLATLRYSLGLLSVSKV